MLLYLLDLFRVAFVYTLCFSFVEARLVCLDGSFERESGMSILLVGWLVGSCSIVGLIDFIDVGRICY